MYGVWIILGLLLGALLARADRYTLHHRINPSTTWSARGVVTLDEGGQASYEDLTGKPRPWDALTGYQVDSTQLYQLALTPESTRTVGLDSPMTFARVCLLDTDSDESITIHSDPDATTLGLSYDLVGIDASKLANNGCPISRTAVQNAKGLSVHVTTPDAPLSPLPPSPPPVKADGSPLGEGEELPKEKSFVAKYWYYFIPVLLLMAIPTELADSANEDSEEGAGGENPFQAGSAQKVTGGKGAGGGARKR